MSAKKTEFAEHLKAAKMPNLRIETNVAKEKIKDLPGFLKELSSALAATTGKPEQYMVVQVGFIYSFLFALFDFVITVSFLNHLFPP